MSKGFAKTKGGLELNIVKKSGGQKKSREWYRREVFEYLYDNMTDEVEPENYIITNMTQNLRHKWTDMTSIL